MLVSIIIILKKKKVMILMQLQLKVYIHELLVNCLLVSGFVLFFILYDYLINLTMKLTFDG